MSKGKEGLNGKRMIIIGNSYVFYGCAVEHKKRTDLTQASRENDRGYFYQLCRLNGIDVSITNWTFGGHGLYHMFGSPCSFHKECKGERHEDYLLDRYYDYVVISPSGGKPSGERIAADFDYIMDFFRKANPNVKFVCLGNLGCHGYSSFGLVVPETYEYYTTLEKKGVIIADWGKIVKGIIDKEITVPGATEEYTKNSFIVADDGFHPNPLTGYITSLVLYRAITGEDVKGQPFAFTSNTSLNTEFDTYAYLAAHYTTGTTNYPAILASETDVLGLQTLVDNII